MRNGHTIICALLLALTACGRAEQRTKSEPSDDARASYVAAQEQAIALSDGGRLLARTPSFELQHTGDSAFFSGLGMAFFDCEHGAVIEDAVLADIATDGGLVTRHPSKRDVDSSVDQALAIWAGAARRLGCPGSAERWAAAGSLKPAGASDFPFGAVRRLLRHRLGQGDKPGIPERVAMEQVAAKWASGVLAAHEACYRVHLAYRALRTMEVLGESITEKGKADFCKATAGAGLANIDWWCGRGDFAQFLASFEPNRFQYAFQRCPYEAADGNGDQTPPLDEIEALYETYAF